MLIKSVVSRGGWHHFWTGKEASMNPLSVSNLLPCCVLQGPLLRRPSTFKTTLGERGASVAYLHTPRERHTQSDEAQLVVKMWLSAFHLSIDLLYSLARACCNFLAGLALFNLFFLLATASIACFCNKHPLRPIPSVLFSSVI